MDERDYIQLNKDSKTVLPHTYKVIVSGSRDYTNYKLIKSTLDHLLNEVNDIEIVHGNCRGVDKLAERYAKENGYKCTSFPADWDKNGKQAGAIRNLAMAYYGDMLVAFPSKDSKGTFDMINKARNKGLRLVVIHV